ncbi:MAG TPA: YicC family protein [Candidatus Brocadiia bacterium]|nr:YicC family protein [Candidatus Brocadiia bacterium]
MLNSMTGYGKGAAAEGERRLVCEITSVNNRYLRLVLKMPDSFNGLTARIEKIIREKVVRGTLDVSVSYTGEAAEVEKIINFDAAAGYYHAIMKLGERLGLRQELSIVGILGLPGVVDKYAADEIDLEKVWALFEPALRDAAANLNDMRRQEGESLHKELTGILDEIRRATQAIKTALPKVRDEYRERLLKRVQSLLDEHGVKVSDADLCREMAIFSERSDVTEELSRMESHIGQVEQLMSNEEAVGRKLEFVSQEMLREANTLGSKISDSALSFVVVGLKAEIEKFREQALNVE